MLSKDLLCMNDLTPDDIYTILDTAEVMKRIVKSGNKKTTYLQGRRSSMSSMKILRGRGFPLSLLENI